MLGFVEPSPNVNVPCSIFHNPFPRALRGIRVRVPRQAHLERQMLCLQGHPRILRILRDVRFLWAKPFREPTLRPTPLYDTRGPQPFTRPRAILTDLLLLPVSSQQVYWKNDESSSDKPPFLSLCPLPAAAVRYDHPLASPPFNNFAPNWHEVNSRLLI